MFVAQSSLSRNISALEEELGVQLFIRTKKYVRLTPAGIVWLDEFRKIEKMIKETHKKAIDVHMEQTSSIRIGMIEAQDSESFLPKAIGYLKQTFPNISIELLWGNYRDLREMLRNGEIDVALTLSLDLNSYADQNIEFEYFYESFGACVISKYHPLANEETIQLEDLKDEALIIIAPEISQGGYDSLLKLCKEHSFTPKKIQHATSVEHIMLLVESGLGFSVLDTNCKLHNNHSVRFIRLKEDDVLKLVGVWHKDNNNPVVSVFMNYLVDSQLEK